MKSLDPNKLHELAKNVQLANAEAERLGKLEQEAKEAHNKFRFEEEAAVQKFAAASNEKIAKSLAVLRKLQEEVAKAGKALVEAQVAHSDYIHKEEEEEAKQVQA